MERSARTSRSQNEQSAAGACLRPIKPLCGTLAFGSARRYATLHRPRPREQHLKWLPPIPVNVDDPDALPATIKPVPPPD